MVFLIGLHTEVNFYWLIMFTKSFILDFQLGTEYTASWYLNYSAFMDL